MANKSTSQVFISGRPPFLAFANVIVPDPEGAGMPMSQVDPRTQHDGEPVHVGITSVHNIAGQLCTVSLDFQASGAFAHALANRLRELADRIDTGTHATLPASLDLTDVLVRQPS
jgi:hypothetical protein